MVGTGRVKRIAFLLCFGALCLLLARLLPDSRAPQGRLGEPSAQTYAPPTYTPRPRPLQLSTAHERPPDELLEYLRSELEKSRTEMEYCKEKQSLAQRWRRKFKKEFFVKNSWEHFFASITNCASYEENAFDSVVRPVLDDLRTRKVEKAKIFGEGTQVKLLVTFEGGLQANFKPKRFDRDFETDPNHFYFSDFERHNAEVAAFHLDRVLGLRRGIPTTTRLFNLSSEILPVAHPKLNKTFFTSPSGNLCFAAKCDYYCDTTHSICGHPHMKEAMLQVWLPDEDYVPRHEQRSAYKRTYSKHSPLADWQKDDDYCRDKVVGYKFFAHGRTLHDLVEMHVYDFFTGNQDRHHFETWEGYFKRQTYSLFLDQGRGFGSYVGKTNVKLTLRSYWDDMDILKPLVQCCVVRPAFLRKLLDIAASPEGLSGRLRASLADTELPLFLPVLAEKHYVALDRRMALVLKAVAKCLREEGAAKVLTNEYHNPGVEEGEGETLENSKSE